MNQLDDIGVLTRCGYRALFQGNDLGPLAQAPKIRFLHTESRYDVYDGTGKETELETAAARSVEIVLYLRDVEKALTLASGTLTVRSGALVLRPCAPGKGISLHFSRGLIVPEAEFSPEAGKEHSVKLLCRVSAEAATGKLFTLA